MDWLECTPQHQAAWSVQKSMWAVIRQWAIESALKDAALQSLNSLANCQLPRNMLKPFIFVSLSIHFWFLCFSSIRPFFEFTQVHSPCRIFGCVKTAFSGFLARQMRCAKWRCEGRRLSWLKFDVGHHRPWMHFAKREFIRSYMTRLIRSGCFHYITYLTHDRSDRFTYSHSLLVYQPSAITPASLW